MDWKKISCFILLVFPLILLLGCEEVLVAPTTTTTTTTIPSPLSVTADANTLQVTLTWGEVAGAVLYNIYWSNTSGVTPGTGTKISNVSSPYVHYGLTNGQPYYYIVTAVDSSSNEGAVSTQVSATPQTIGILDDTFGGGGFVIHHNAAGGNGHDYAYSIKIDSVGRIVVAGQSINASGNEDLVIWRYNADGTLDSSFGSGGIVVNHNLAGGDHHENAWALAIDSMDRLIVVGRSQHALGTEAYDMVVCRYDVDGSLDPTFGTAGVAIHNNGAGGDAYDSGYSVAIDALGRILIGGGSTNAAGNSDLVVWRYTADGVLDSTFGTGGVVVHTDALGVNAGERATCVTTDSSDKILCAGYGSNPSGNSDMPVWRFNEDGSLDTSFSADGYLVRVSEAGGDGHDTGGSITVDRSGKILVCGASQNSRGDMDLVIWRFNNDGTLDTSLAGDGTVIHHNATGGASDEGAAALAIDSADRIIVTGYGRNLNGDFDTIIMRYNGFGVLDPTFGSGGVVFHNNAAGGNDDDQALSLALDSLGRIVIAGYSKNASGNHDLVVWRYK